MADTTYRIPKEENSTTSGFSVNSDDAGIAAMPSVDAEARIARRLRSGPFKPAPYWAFEIEEATRMEKGQFSSPLKTSATIEPSSNLPNRRLATPSRSPTKNTHKRKLDIAGTSPKPDGMDAAIDTDMSLWPEDRLSKRRRLCSNITPALVLQRWRLIQATVRSRPELFEFPSYKLGRSVDVFYSYIYWNGLIAINHIILSIHRILAYYQRYDDDNGIARLSELSDLRGMLPSTLGERDTSVPSLSSLIERVSEPLFLAMTFFHRKNSSLVEHLGMLALRCDEMVIHTKSITIIFGGSS